MALRKGILVAAAVALISSPALAGELGSELEEVGAQIDEQHQEWETALRTEVLSLYLRALRAHEEGDDEAAREALAEVKERMGN